MSASGPTWDPGQYLRYAGERARPYWDLVGRILVDDARVVVDLGCGPGTQTAGLRQRWPEARVLGIDSSPEMIARAATLADPPGLAFELADLRSWTGTADVVVSNATLQWVPGHLALLPRWVASLAPGGALAIGVPANFSAPTHALLRELAEQPRWCKPLAGVSAMLAIHPPADYRRALQATGATTDIWETTYYHVLTGPDPVLEWVRGSALRPYLDALDPGEAADFEAAYAGGLRHVYPADERGETVLPFRRLFVVATVPVSD